MIEIIMIVIVLIVSLISAITDWMNGKIYNRLIGYTIIPAIVLVIGYYWGNRSELLLFVTNGLAAITIAVLFFAMKIWGAGDSKLWLFVNLIYPTGRYIMTDYMLFPSMFLLMLIFLEAYAYVILESLYIRFVKREQGAIQNKFQIHREWIENMIFSVCFLSVLYAVLSMVIGPYFEPNRVLFALLGVLLASKLASVKIPHKGSICVVLVVVYITILWLVGAKPDIHMVFLTLVIVLVSNMSLQFAGKYNYMWIPTEDVKERMILSALSIQMFCGSRVKNLPTYSDESTKSRISAVEAEAIRRWGKSKLGQDRILIVRYIPFAVFVFIGIISYLIGSVVL